MYPGDFGARRSSLVREEIAFPPYPAGGAVILPDEDERDAAEGDRLLRLCNDIAGAERRNVSRTFVGGTEEVASLVDFALEDFQERIKHLISRDEIRFVSKESQALNARKQTLTKLVQSLKREMAEWQGIQEKHESTPAPAAVADGAYEEAEAEGRKKAAAHAAGAALSEAYLGALSDLDVQVNSVCGAVASVESLCAKADKAASTLQVKYHERTFNPFPHVDSPAALVRSLARPPAP